MSDTTKTPLEVRNRKSASQLVIEQNACIDFINNPKRPGHKFFTCGNIAVGYISPKVRQAEADGTLKIEDMQYCETRKPGEEKWVPCLMMVSKTNVSSSFGASLLH